MKHPSLEPYVELDATAEDCDVVNVKREILSGKYKVILVCDLSENFDWLVIETVCISAVRNDDLGSCGVSVSACLNQSIFNLAPRSFVSHSRISGSPHNFDRA